MRQETTDQPGRRRSWTSIAGASAPYWFAAAGLALGAGGIVQDQPVAGACGAVAGVTAGLIQVQRARFHRDHAEALRERLRTHRLEADRAASELRQTVSALQTDLWHQRMVALATPAYGISLPAGPVRPSAPGTTDTGTVFDQASAGTLVPRRIGDESKPATVVPKRTGDESEVAKAS